MSHFPKKTIIALGLLTSFMALPILGIPWVAKAYIFFFLGLGVVTTTYAGTTFRKKREKERRSKPVLSFPDRTSNLLDMQKALQSSSPSKKYFSEGSFVASEPRMKKKNTLPRKEGRPGMAIENKKTSLSESALRKNATFPRVELRHLDIRMKPPKKRLEKESTITQ